MFHPTISAIAERIIGEPGYQMSFDESCELALLSETHPLDLIMCANKIRSRYSGCQVFTCAIINARSGLCSEDCAFCAQSAHHSTSAQAYALISEDELIGNGIRLDSQGVSKYSMVTSGYALTPEELKTICRAAVSIRSGTNLKMCASLGMLTEDGANLLKASGVARYHHNLETARSYFHQICTTHGYDEAVETVRAAKRAGMEVCSGGIMGLGESWEQRVELAFTLRELDVDAVPINFLNPIPGTRLEMRPVLSPMEGLRCIALFRFIHPQKDIVVCGGRAVTLKDYQSWVFMAGANGLMVGDYLTTPGRSIGTDMEMIAAMGLKNGADVADGHDELVGTGSCPVSDR